MRIIELMFGRKRTKLSKPPSASPPSATVDITFNVTVCPGTTCSAAIYVAGSFNDWNPAGQAMTWQDPNRATTLVTAQRGQRLEYKYTRGTWDQVEKGLGGEELPNRRLTVPQSGDSAITIKDTVEAWSDDPLIETDCCERLLKAVNASNKKEQQNLLGILSSRKRDSSFIPTLVETVMRGHFDSIKPAVAIIEGIGGGQAVQALADIINSLKNLISLNNQQAAGCAAESLGRLKVTANCEYCPTCLKCKSMMAPVSFQTGMSGQIECSHCGEKHRYTPDYYKGTWNWTGYLRISRLSVSPWEEQGLYRSIVPSKVVLR